MRRHEMTRALSPMCLNVSSYEDIEMNNLIRIEYEEF